MNGATTEPSARINNPPKTTIIKMIGLSQSLFLCFKNSNNSFKKSKKISPV